MLSSLPQLYFPFRNSTNFAKINTPETNENALTVKVNAKRAKKNIKNSQTDKKGNKLLKISTKSVVNEFPLDHDSRC